MSNTGFRIRRLDGGDVHILRPVRLAALRLHPAAFGNSFEEESQAPLDDMARRLLLPPATMFGAFAGHSLVGIAGLMLQTRIKTRHRADIFSVYVDAAHRGCGAGPALVAAVTAQARGAGVRVLQLTVTAGNDTARRMYEALGFRSFAVEPRALLVDGVFYDNQHMMLELDRP